MQDLFLLMATMFCLEGINAVIQTKRKEKIMIEEGGAPLPQSSYVFLVIQYVFKVLISLVLYLLMVLFSINTLGMVWKWLILLSSYGVVVFLSRVCEVAIRTAIVRHLTKKYVEEIKEKETM